MIDRGTDGLNAMDNATYTAVIRNKACGVDIIQ